MAKVKIHEIAKEMNLSSKEVVDRANELGFDVKSHLSSVEEDEAIRIKEAIGGGKKADSKKDVEKKAVKDKKKEATPVIIRREVIVSEDNKPEKEEKKKTDRSNIGFVDETRAKTITLFIETNNKNQ